VSSHLSKNQSEKNLVRGLISTKGRNMKKSKMEEAMNMPKEKDAKKPIHTIVIGIDLMKQKADKRLDEIEKEEADMEEADEAPESKEGESTAARAKEAIKKPESALSLNDAADILLAAEGIKKDTVLMKEVNLLMKKKQGDLAKITEDSPINSISQLKAKALKVGAGD